jgi:hypothetical protein
VSFSPQNAMRLPVASAVSSRLCKRKAVVLMATVVHGVSRNATGA